MKKISLVLINSHTHISIMCILLISGVKCCIVCVWLPSYYLPRPLTLCFFFFSIEKRCMTLSYSFSFFTSLLLFSHLITNWSREPHELSVQTLWLNFKHFTNVLLLVFLSRCMNRTWTELNCALISLEQRSLLAHKLIFNRFMIRLLLNLSALFVCFLIFTL